MWLPQNIVDEVNRAARVFYIGAADTALWNENRREGELRLLTGWCWSARLGGQSGIGLKSRSMAYREAWYALIEQRAAPGLTRTKLRLVSKRRAA